MARGGGSASGVWQRLTLRNCAIIAEGTLLGVLRWMPQLWKLWAVERESLDPRTVSDRANAARDGKSASELLRQSLQSLADAELRQRPRNARRGLDGVRTTRTLDECRNWLEAQRLKERRIKAKFRPRRKKKEPLSSNS